jgi:iron complex outermembrane receptor protein
VQTVIAENEHFYKWHSNQQLNVGVNVTSNTAITQNYSSSKSLTKLSLLLGNKGEYLKNKLLIYSQIRFEYYKINTTPITGNISTTYFLLKNTTCKLNIAKIFRMPTLNELYWQPGGNINLKPEQGYTYEGELNYTKQINSNVLVFVSGAFFNRTINDWILWTPGANQNPQPLNIQKVWSRGSETTWKLQFQRNKFRAILNSATGYVLSTIQSNYQENNSSENKQLIYTPRYTVNTNFSIAYDNLILTYYHQYIGYRFTTSDNTNWLNPYHYSSLRFNSVLKLNQSTLVFYASCNNLLNKNYTILSAQPMPLRNFEVGISLQYKKGK